MPSEDVRPQYEVGRNTIKAEGGAGRVAMLSVAEVQEVDCRAGGGE